MRHLKIHNGTYSSLTSNHTRYHPCACDDCLYEQDFTVEFEFTRKSYEGGQIDSFKVYDKDMIDVTDRLSVKDYDKLVIEIEDWAVINSDYDPYESIIKSKNYHYE